MAKIKQGKNSLERVIDSSFVALFMVVSIYMYQNINIVMNMISYKKSISKIAALEKNLLAVNDKAIEYKNTLSVKGLESNGDFKKVDNKNFVVRKNMTTSLTLLYGIR